MMNFRAGLAERPTYDTTERDWQIKVNANESPFNLPPLVEERVMARLSRVAFNRYPNEETALLRRQIAQSYGLSVENVWLGNGSSEIIEKLFFAFGGQGKKIVYPTPSFSMYEIYAQAAETEGVPIASPDDYQLDAEAFIKTVRESRAALAVVCNPNNPTGNYIPREEIGYIAAKIDGALLIDEAYIEFAGESASVLLEKYSNLMVARTFSKAYGLAACRVGYLLADRAVIDVVKKAYMPYSLNVLSAVTADIVYQMRDEYRPRIDMIIAERQRMFERLSSIDGLNVFPSAANFLLCQSARAEKLCEALAAQGIGVRNFGNAVRLENALRLSIGTREENDRIFQAISDFMAGR